MFLACSFGGLLSLIGIFPWVVVVCPLARNFPWFNMANIYIGPVFLISF